MWCCEIRELLNRWSFSQYPCVLIVWVYGAFGQWCRSVSCQYDSIHECACVSLQGVNRLNKDAQMGRDGVRRKDWHDYEAIKRDLSRSGRSKPPYSHSYTVKYRWELCNIFIMDSVFTVMHKKDSYIPRVTIFHTQIILFLLWVLLLSNSAPPVQICALKAVSAVINTVYICYNNH